MPVRLYVGNLPKELDRKELQDVFVEEGDSVSAKVITDRKTGKCRGFGFVTVQTDEIADQIVEKYNGFMFKENPLKIEKPYPVKKGKVTNPRVHPRKNLVLRLKVPVVGRRKNQIEEGIHLRVLQAVHQVLVTRFNPIRVGPIN
jgi:RNA recognition motif-containing protein